MPTRANKVRSGRAGNEVTKGRAEDSCDGAPSQSSRRRERLEWLADRRAPHGTCSAPRRAVVAVSGQLMRRRMRRTRVPNASAVPGVVVREVEARPVAQEGGRVTRRRRAGRNALCLIRGGAIGRSLSPRSIASIGVVRSIAVVVPGPAEPFAIVATRPIAVVLAPPQGHRGRPLPVVTVVGGGDGSARRCPRRRRGDDRRRGRALRPHGGEAGAAASWARRSPATTPRRAAALGARLQSLRGRGFLALPFASGCVFEDRLRFQIVSVCGCASGDSKRLLGATSTRAAAAVFLHPVASASVEELVRCLVSREVRHARHRWLGRGRAGFHIGALLRPSAPPLRAHFLRRCGHRPVRGKSGPSSA
jgi:hypothetical protein